MDEDEDRFRPPWEGDPPGASSGQPRCRRQRRPRGQPKDGEVPVIVPSEVLYTAYGCIQWATWFTVQKAWSSLNDRHTGRDARRCR